MLEDKNMKKINKIDLMEHIVSGFCHKRGHNYRVQVIITV